MSVVARVLLAPLGYATATGVMINYCISRSGLDLTTTQRYAVACFCAIAVAVICLVDTLTRIFVTRVTELASVIHKEAWRLKKSSCIKFLLPPGDANIAYILLEIRDNVAFIRYVTRGELSGHEHPRWCEVEPNGRVARCSKDSLWRNSPLIPQLEDVLSVLHRCVPDSEIGENELCWARSAGHKPS